MIQKGNKGFMTINETIALQYMGGDVSLLREMLTYALEIKEERWAEIQHAYDTKDFSCYEIKTHGLKGAMRYFGLTEISDFCKLQETACHQGDFAQVEHNHLQMQHLYEDAHTCIQKYLQSNQAH